MSHMRRILLATDFQAASRLAADAAVELSWAFGAQITLLHVVEPAPATPVVQQVQQAMAERLLAALADELQLKKAPVDGRLIEVGPPAATIARQADLTNSDLIVIGAGDRSGNDVYRPGRIAQAVIERATQPVLAIRPDGPPASFRRLLCPVDFSDAAQRGLANAARLARAFQSKLVVLGVVPEVSWVTRPLIPEDAQWLDEATRAELKRAAQRYHDDWRARFEEFVSRVDLQGLKSAQEVRGGSVDEQIVSAAREHQCDLIVMGSTGRGGPLHALLGGVTRRVLHELPCSILTIKREDVLVDLADDDQRMAELLLAEGRALHAAGSDELACVKFRQALAHNASLLPAMELLAASSERLGRGDEAAAHRRRLAALRASLGLAG